ncbi:hypothetical protein FRC12_024094 [Ceratobasidium sp. 428]|nr:hypothetical protein FRC12_024094 [Ceratobasidium sp. 428]
MVTGDEEGEEEAHSVGEDDVGEVSIQEREPSVITISSGDDLVDSGVNLYEGLPEYVYNIDRQNNIGFEAAPIADGFWQVRPRYGTIRYRGCCNMRGPPLSRSRCNTWSILKGGLHDARPAVAATVADIHYSLDGDKITGCAANAMEPKKEVEKKGKLFRNGCLTSLATPTPLILGSNSTSVVVLRHAGLVESRPQAWELGKFIV